MPVISPSRSWAGRSVAGSTSETRLVFSSATLAGAVRPQQAHHPAGRELHRQAIERHRVAVALGQVLDREHRHGP
jgi:hypothetical protein